MDQIFPAANIVAGVLVLLVGFGVHFGAQLVSVLNWDLATRWGLQESGLRPEHKNYEHAIAVSDVLVAWTYGIAGVGLIIDASWAYAWAWIPGGILTYHALGFWMWTRNHRRSGDHYGTTKNPVRPVCLRWWILRMRPRVPRRATHSKKLRSRSSTTRSSVGASSAGGRWSVATSGSSGPSRTKWASPKRTARRRSRRPGWP